jgi:threonine dehydratase
MCTATMLDQYVKRVLSARVYDVAVETPLEHARLLSERTGTHVLLKREDLQPIHSFKLRGAYNRMASLTAAERARGVVTASAGNHAQGVALSASRLSLAATVVMGVNTPDIKSNAVRALGARVVLAGDTYDEAAAHARALAERDNLALVHPYDDADVIAGQGTIGMELLRQHQGAIDAVFVPVGGGGLIAGIGAYVKYLRPHTRIIGVEAEGSACLAAALAAGRRVRLPTDQLDLFADGVSVAQVGREPFRIARRCVDAVVTASADEICAAVKDIFDDTRAIAEPAGALAVAGLKKYAAGGAHAGETLIGIVSGANVNFDRLRYISERAEVGESREAIFAVTIPEQPGSFRRFCRSIGKRSVTEFNYRIAPGREAEVFVGVSVRNAGDRQSFAAALRSHGYASEDMTDNEMAKQHVRHMVGGRAPLDDEVIYSFRFPERPGALMRFLDVAGSRFNISMFHYRNHGSATGSVLAGFQVPEGARRAFRRALDDIGYPCTEETANSAYQRFLR